MIMLLGQVLWQYRDGSLELREPVAEWPWRFLWSRADSHACSIGYRLMTLRCLVTLRCLAPPTPAPPTPAGPIEEKPCLVRADGAARRRRSAAPSADNCFC